MTRTFNRVWPDVAIHPGEHIQDFYEDDDGFSVSVLASEAGLREHELQAFIDGKASVTPEIANGLSKVLASEPKWWINLQTLYEQEKARIEENQRFSMARYVDFSTPISGVVPIDDLTDSGEVPERYNKVEQARYLCEWLGISELDGYDERILGHFQRSNRAHSPKPAPLVVWLRRGELMAREQSGSLPPYGEAVLEVGAKGLRPLTLETPEVFVSAMRDACNAAGVAFVALPYMPGSGIRGVARWLDDGRPMVQINDHGHASDLVWFTFYHEVAHVLNGDQDYLDLEEPAGGVGFDEVPEAERLANEYAEDALVPRPDWNELLERIADGPAPSNWRGSADRFAAQQGIHRGIVVGRLLHSGVIGDWQAYHGCKQPFSLQ